MSPCYFCAFALCQATLLRASKENQEGNIRTVRPDNPEGSRISVTCDGFLSLPSPRLWERVAGFREEKVATGLSRQFVRFKDVAGGPFCPASAAFRPNIAAAATGTETVAARAAESAARVRGSRCLARGEGKPGWCQIGLNVQTQGG